MKKVLGYIRVSTELQKIKENSINNQIQSINEYCNRCDFDLVEVYDDEILKKMWNINDVEWDFIDSKIKDTDLINNRSGDE